MIQEVELVPKSISAKPLETRQKPLSLSGALDKYESFDITPVIGKEFPKANVVEWMNDANSDELLRDLAITSESSMFSVQVCSLICLLHKSLSTRGRCVPCPE